jgi:hypothetical protein
VKHLKHPATIIAALALFVALGGGAVAYAAGVINGSQIKNHSIATKKLTKKAIAQLHGARGARGPAGATGAAGAPGAPGAKGDTGPAGPGARWALVNPDGTIARQSGGIAVSKPQPGGYVANFGSDVSRDLIVVTPALINDGNFRGVVIAGSCVDYATFCTGSGVPDATKQNWVAVFTTDTTNGNQEDHAYYVAAMGPVSLAPAPRVSSGMGALGK